MEGKVPSRQTIQALQRAKEQAEIANCSKSNFLAIMSHELRTPLNVVLGMAELLRNKKVNPPEQQECLEMILQSGHDMLDIINDIVDFARLEAGTLKFHSEAVPLQKIIERVIKNTQYKLRDKPVALIVDYHFTAPRMALGDPQRIRQILTNLIDNASKYTEQGHILIKVEKDTEQPAQVRITVSDTGIGIAPEQIPQIFERFKQIDDPKLVLANSARGMGLGLTITKQLLELMQGTIQVTSQPGKGSNFVITLPIFKATEIPTPCYTLNQLAALIVDDNVIRRDVLNEQLKNHGMQCMTLANEGFITALREPPIAKQTYQVIIIYADDYDQHTAYIGRTLRSIPRFANALLVLAVPGELYDYETEQAIAGGYSCVLDILQTSTFATHLANVWQRWKNRNQSNIMPTITTTRYRILLVEDNQLNQKVGQMMLTSMGCDVDLASDGKTALNLLTQKHYDLVFMDVGLPDLSGLDVTERFRQQQVGQRHTPVIGLTAHAMTNDKQKSLEAGMDDYLVKPLLQERLQSILDKWLIHK